MYALYLFIFCQSITQDQLIVGVVDKIVELRKTLGLPSGLKEDDDTNQGRKEREREKEKDNCQQICSSTQ